jgi:hypothetical protein
MEKESKFGAMFQSFSDKIQDQVWFQQGKAKWDELDARAKTALKYASLIGSAFLVVSFVASSLYSVAAQKNEIDEKLALIQKIQGAQDELRRLKEVTSRFNGGGDEPWGQFLQQKGASAGIDPTTVQILTEGVLASGTTPPPRGKPAKGSKEPEPAATVGPEETVIEAALKKVNVRQLTKYLHEIENGGRTVKVRSLKIDTHPDASGYLDASIVVSAFRLR